MKLSLPEIKTALQGKESFTIADLEMVFAKSDDTIKQRKATFKDKLSNYSGLYCVLLLDEFFDYWSEHGEKDRKMRFEKQKSFDINLRLKQWQRRSKNYAKPELSRLQQMNKI